jgi:adenylate cyclase
VAGDRGHHFLFRPLDLVVPAISRVAPPFELVGALGDAADGASAAAIDRCRAWRHAIELYRRRRRGEACDQFRRLAECHPADRPASLYLERCARFLAVPPPADWDGAEHYDSK